ncbi:MAG: phosphoribosyltransferase [Sediminibacterium magnilacihabitans]|nr:phosphoribosyltransferase [Sediminibacterium magnilacihabitans]PQV59522.1 pyrimidine operon attenuation protein/uracil phosphoribosyltransferase [Sediminibacterium magnilacihabitans]
MPGKKNILNKEAAIQKLHRMALELAENLNGDGVPVVLIGIRNSGMVVAEKIGSFLKQYIASEIRIIAASLDKTLPKEVTLSESIDFNGLHVVLIDDVTDSGRTLLYALKPLLSYHPKSIQTMVLVERMHKLFPVKPDYVGLSIATTLQDHIQVEVSNGEVEGAYIV